MDTDCVFREIYSATVRDTDLYLTAKCRDPGDAADLAQEVYLELYRLLRKRGPGYVQDPAALIRRITKQKLARYYRRRQAEPVLRGETPLEDGGEVDIADIEALSVEEIVCEQDRRERAVAMTKQILASKDPATRQVFHLYYRLELTIGEIARMLGRGESDVKNRLYRTLKEIRAALEEA